MMIHSPQLESCLINVKHGGKFDLDIPNTSISIGSEALPILFLPSFFVRFELVTEAVAGARLLTELKIKITNLLKLASKILKTVFELAYLRVLGSVLLFPQTHPS